MHRTRISSTSHIYLIECMTMNMFITDMYVSMENRIFSCREEEILSLKYLSIMKQESLGSKVDPEHCHIVTMSLFCYVYKESISSEYDIGTLFDRFLEFSNTCGSEKLLDLSDISRASVIEKREMISIFLECKFVLIHICYDKILFLIVAYFREKIQFYYLFYRKNWRHRHLMSIHRMSRCIYLHHFSCSSRELFYTSLDNSWRVIHESARSSHIHILIIFSHCPFELIIGSTDLVFIG